MPDYTIDISIVVPIYNSSQTISILVSRVQDAMRISKLNYELILTDDCSTDDTWKEILKISKSNDHIIGLRLDKNYGQWCSTIAGISKAAGKYIVTIDDDLEYDPEDILRLYDTITHSRFSVVFGMAKEKYRLQGKNPELSNLRNKLLNFLWNKPPMDSFKIMERSLVYKDQCFLPQEPLDVFITHNLDVKFWGYCDINFNKRYFGQSNHSIIKKIKLFFLYNSFFGVNLLPSVITCLILFFVDIYFVFFFKKAYSDHHFFSLVLEVMLPVIILVGLFYILTMLSKPRGLLYRIEKTTDLI